MGCGFFAAGEPANAALEATASRLVRRRLFMEGFWFGWFSSGFRQPVRMANFHEKCNGRSEEHKPLSESRRHYHVQVPGCAAVRWRPTYRGASR